MAGIRGRGTLLDIPLIQERYGRSVMASFGIHLLVVFVLVVAPYLLPQPEAVVLGSGPGGGSGGDSFAVGLADELSGGVGMTKPSLTPQPPPLPADKPAVKEEPPSNAVALPDTITPKKPRKAEQASANSSKKPIPAMKSTNVIPTAPMPGAGGNGGLGGGSGGGRGGGIGVSIGSGTGGFGDSWYARAVESRISSNWIRPPAGIQVEVVYSFFIATDGSIYNIQKEKSSGNDALDLTAERAIRASNPLAAPPPELRGRPLQFIAQFVHPPPQ
jgi:TonB family protein